MMGALRKMMFVVVYLTLTDPLRIQPWSQVDGTKPNQTEGGKPGKTDRRKGEESSPQRTSSPGRDTEADQKKKKVGLYVT